MTPAIQKESELITASLEAQLRITRAYTLWNLACACPFFHSLTTHAIHDACRSCRTIEGKGFGDIGTPNDGHIVGVQSTNVSGY